ncbi:hypothetical protein ANN_02958 [Periplaneta americana]|uniref:Uncharacterized protein n=1 Tax=Periplaneta americana TaxID=6978 RepID=A0ABQ8TXQ5_PERAM|nr:hypothetical protein ANN_02958 [Periplaneta americana]
MMQSPLMGYSTLTHFLEMRQQQCPIAGRTPVTPSSPSLYMYSALRQQAMTAGTSGNMIGDSSSSGSPSPPSSATSSSTMGKSFTIDAILGLGDANKLDCGTAKCVATDLSTNATSAGARGTVAGARHPGVSERAAATVAAVLHPLQASYAVTTCRRPSQGLNCYVRQVTWVIFVNSTLTDGPSCSIGPVLKRVAYLISPRTRSPKYFLHQNRIPISPQSGRGPNTGLVYGKPGL